MSKAVEFFKRVAEDSSLNSAVKAAVEKAGSKDEEVLAVANIAKEAGFDVTAGELKTYVVSALKEKGELSDSELESVAGGVGDLVINTGDISVTGLVVNVSPGDAIGAVTGAVDAAGTIADAIGMGGGSGGCGTGNGGIIAPTVPSSLSGW